jgi:dienelactone hydrolase
MRRGICAVVPVIALLGGAFCSSAQNSAGPRVVDLTAADGTVLKATFFAAAKPGPGVILLHQCNRQRKVWDDLAGRLAASGISVITLDFRGFGDSGGAPLDKLTPEKAGRDQEEVWPGDVDLALHYLESQPGVNHDLIGAGGASCGVNQAVQLARRQAEVKSLVLLSEGTDRQGRAFLRKSPGLPLFLAAADDDPDDLGVVDVMEWLRDLSPDPANVFEHYTTGGHGVVMFEAHKELPGKIVEWFETTLIKTPGSAPVTRKPGAMSPESRFLEMADEPGGASKAVNLFNEERKRDPKSAAIPEVMMNRMGYEHLQEGDTKGAIEIFKLNVVAFPNSKKTLELLATDTTDDLTRRDGIKASAESKLK